MLCDIINRDRLGKMILNKTNGLANIKVVNIILGYELGVVRVTNQGIHD